MATDVSQAAKSSNTVNSHGGAYVSAFRGGSSTNHTLTRNGRNVSAVTGENERKWTNRYEENQLFDVFANVPAPSTDYLLVSGVTGKAIRVTSFSLTSGPIPTSGTFNTKPAGAGTPISSLYVLGANSTISRAESARGYFQTGIGDGLSISNTSGSALGANINYLLY